METETETERQIFTIPTFRVNIQINRTEIITLDTLCTTHTTILQLKEYIMNERDNINSLDNIDLKYSDELMLDNKTLMDYDILDGRHLIRLTFKVQKSEFNPFDFKKFASISIDTVGNMLERMKSLEKDDTKIEAEPIIQKKPQVKQQNINTDGYIQSSTPKESVNELASMWEDNDTNVQKCGCVCGFLIAYILLLIPVGLIVNAIDIATIVIYKTHDNTSCDNQPENMELKIGLFAYIASILGFISVFLCSLLMLLVITSDDQGFITKKSQYIPNVFGNTFNIAANISWVIRCVYSILGFIIYANASENCQNSSLGQVTSGWCIVTFMLSSFVACCCICFHCK